MPHSIESFMDAERFPWWEGLDGKHANVLHAKGGAVTLKQALKAGEVDWTVELVPLHGFLGRDASRRAKFSKNAAPKHFGLMRVAPQYPDRDGDLLNVVGNRYEPIQNEVPAQLALDIISASRNEAHFVTAGSVDEGRLVFFGLRLPKTIKVAGLDDETIEMYLNIAVPHGPNASGQSAVVLDIDGIRRVCLNTLLMGQRSAVSKLKIVHRSGSSVRLAEARDILKVSFDTVDEFSRELNVLVERSANEKTLETAVGALFPISDEPSQKEAATWDNRYEQIRWVWENSPNLANVKDTNYGVYNALTEWAQWGRPIRGSGGNVEKSHALLGQDLLLGQTGELTTQALNILLTIPGVKKVNLAKAGKTRNIKRIPVPINA